MSYRWYTVSYEHYRSDWWGPQDTIFKRAQDLADHKQCEVQVSGRLNWSRRFKPTPPKGTQLEFDFPS